MVAECHSLNRAGEVVAFGCGVRCRHPRLISRPPRPPGVRSSIGAQRLPEPC